MNVENLVLCLYILSTAFLLLSLLGLRKLFAIRWSWPFTFLKASLCILISLSCLLMASQLSHFFQVFPQKPIVTVFMHKMQDRQYRVQLVDSANMDVVQRLNIAESGGEGVFLNGDQWQLEMRILTWHPLLAQLGMQPLYKLERLNGRYQRLEDEQSLPRSIYELDAIDIATRYWKLMLPYLHGSLISTYYGSAVYAPMADEASYGVFLNPDGVELKALNAEAKNALKVW